MSVPPAARRAGAAVNEPHTLSVGGWDGMDLTNSRLARGAKDKLYLAENLMYVGDGMQAVPLYNGARGAALHAGSTPKESAGFMLTYGANTIPHPVSIVIFEDGSAWMRDHYLDGAVDTQDAVAGTFATSAVGNTGVTIWRDTTILFLDKSAGYCSWDGTTFTVIDATKKGDTLAVFESHVWLKTAARTVSYTSPNSFSDFTAGLGAGTFSITDDAFVGAIIHLQSTVEQLWLLGIGAIDALGNVATAGGVTTFNVTNAITTLGTNFGDSVIGFFRALVFFTGYSQHSLLGVTPQKLSAAVDRLMPQLTGAITAGPRPGVVTLNGQTVLCLLCSFTDPATAAVRSELLCFQEGKLWLARTPDLNGNRVLDMVTLYVGNTPELYGVDAGGFLYRIFARTTDAGQGTAILSTRLYDLGDPVSGHDGVRVGVDLSAPSTTAISPVTVELVSESQSTTLLAAQVKFADVIDALLGLRYALHRVQAPITGQRLGVTLRLQAADRVCVEAIHLEVTDTGRWLPMDAVPSSFVFTADDGAVFTWTI